MKTSSAAENAGTENRFLKFPRRARRGRVRLRAALSSCAAAQPLRSRPPHPSVFPSFYPFVYSFTARRPAFTSTSYEIVPCRRAYSSASESTHTSSYFRRGTSSTAASMHSALPRSPRSGGKTRPHIPHAQRKAALGAEHNLRTPRRRTHICVRLRPSHTRASRSDAPSGQGKAIRQITVQPDADANHVQTIFLRGEDAARCGDVPHDLSERGPRPRANRSKSANCISAVAGSSGR